MEDNLVNKQIKYANGFSKCFLDFIKKSEESDDGQVNQTKSTNPNKKRRHSETIDQTQVSQVSSPDSRLSNETREDSEGDANSKKIARIDPWNEIDMIVERIETNIKELEHKFVDRPNLKLTPIESTDPQSSKSNEDQNQFSKIS